MSTDPFSQFMPAVCAGFGLLLVGGVNLLLSRRERSVRVLASAAALGAAVATAAAMGHGVLVRAAPFLALGLVPCLFASHRIAERSVTLVRWLHRPSAHFGVLVAIGLALAAGGLFLYERADDAQADAATDALEKAQGKPPAMLVVGRCWAKTDRGTRVDLGERTEDCDRALLESDEGKLLRDNNLGNHVMRRHPGTAKTNCFGWVFAAGKFLMVAQDVPLILAENGYEDVKEPQPGDLTIYRNGSEIRHVGIVRYVAATEPTMVESKWGEYAVFLHPVDKSYYGTSYTFHRSVRKGHLLAVVDPDSQRTIQ